MCFCVIMMILWRRSWCGNLCRADHVVERVMPRTRCVTSSSYLEVWVSNTGVITARCTATPAGVHSHFNHAEMPPMADNYGRIVVHEMEIPVPTGTSAVHGSVGADIMQETVTAVPVWAR